MPRFVIERDIADIGSAEREALRAASAKSNEVLAAMQAEKKPIQWEHSYVAGNKTFCIYVAASEALVHEHGKRSGFPATKVTPIKRMIDPPPTSGRAAAGPDGADPRAPETRACTRGSHAPALASRRRVRPAAISAQLWSPRRSSRRGCGAGSPG